MGTYIVRADIEEKLPQADVIQLTDDEGDGSKIDSRVDSAIEDAESELEGHVAARFSLPLSPVNALIKGVAVDLAIFHLYARRNGATEDVRQRYEDRIGFLKRAADGKAAFWGKEQADSSSTQPVDILSSDRLSTRKTMKGF